MNLNYLKNYCKEKSEEFPHLKPLIDDLYDLCLDEVESGGSESHEVQLCIQDIKDLTGDED